MPRRASPGQRPVEPDPMYGSKLVQQLINKVMVDGKKSTAEKIVYEALDILAKRTSQDPVPALEESINSLRANMRAASDETAMMPPSDPVIAISSAVSQAAEHVERARAAIRSLSASIGIT